MTRPLLLTLITTLMACQPSDPCGRGLERTQAGTCVPQGVGDSCDPFEPCKVGLMCVLPGETNQGLCLPTCQSMDNDCAQLQGSQLDVSGGLWSCEAMIDGPDVCFYIEE